VGGTLPDGSPARAADGDDLRRAGSALYDVPLRRDWLFWLTVFWVAMPLAIDISTAAAGKSTAWVGGVGAAILLAICLGVVPALLRLWFRKRRLARYLRRSHRDLRGSWDDSAAGKPVSEAAVGWPVPEADGDRRPPGNRGQAEMPKNDAVGTSTAFTQLNSDVVPVADAFGGADAHVDAPSVQVLQDTCTAMPFPIASALRRLQRAHNAKDRYEAALESGETLAITTAVTLAALLRRECQRDRTSTIGRSSMDADLLRLRSALLGRPMTFGSWTFWLGQLAANTADHPALTGLLNRTLHDAPAHRGLLSCLNALREERNRAAHRKVTSAVVVYVLATG
jgi:hypothetical protein